MILAQAFMCLSNKLTETRYDTQQSQQYAP
ncbi:Uncharacterised protein [Bordetella pertussis]|nr:Uncharacterised protein [Bordetella pertussis]